MALKVQSFFHFFILFINRFNSNINGLLLRKFENPYQRFIKNSQFTPSLLEVCICHEQKGPFKYIVTSLKKEMAKEYYSYVQLKHTKQQQQYKMCVLWE